MTGVVVLDKMDFERATSISVPTSLVTSTSATNASATATFPLMSKRFELQQKKAIASALELPSSATVDDLTITITGKLQELDHNPASVQVVVTNSEEGETLSLQDVDGVFLTLTVTQQRTTTLLSDQEVSSLMTGSSRSSPAFSYGETGNVVYLPHQVKDEFGIEEENLRRFSSLCRSNCKNQRKGFKKEGFKR